MRYRKALIAKMKWFIPAHVSLLLFYGLEYGKQPWWLAGVAFIGYVVGLLGCAACSVRWDALIDTWGIEELTLVRAAQRDTSKESTVLLRVL